MERAPSLKSTGDERTSREPTLTSSRGDGKDGIKPSRPPCRFFLLVSVIAGSVPRIVRFGILFFQWHEKLKLEKRSGTILRRCFNEIPKSPGGPVFSCACTVLRFSGEKESIGHISVQELGDRRAFVFHPNLLGFSSETHCRAIKPLLDLLYNQTKVLSQVDF